MVEFKLPHHFEAEQVYDNLASTYDQKYVSGENNPYMADEAEVARIWKKQPFSKESYLSNRRILSLGCGTGQDIEILGYPDPERYVGVDISNEMLNKAREKFSDYTFIQEDVNTNTEDFPPQCEILVSMFGVPNYIQLHRMWQIYTITNAEHAFLVYYKSTYRDGVIDHFDYPIGEMRAFYKKYNPTFEMFGNYVVCSW